MAPKTISAYKARTQFGQLIDEVRYKKQPYIIEKNGRPAVVIIDSEEYDRLRKLSLPLRLYTRREIQGFLKEDKLSTRLKSKLDRILAEK